MIKRFVNEKTAVLAIGALFVLALAGSLFFALSAHAYAADGPDSAALSSGTADGGTSHPASSPREELSGSAPPSGAPLPPVEAATALPAQPSGAADGDEADEAGAGTPPQETLDAELRRLGAMGVALPGIIAPEYVGEFYATAYCCEVYPHICGGNGVTASGTVPLQGLTAAADWNVLPPGTWIYIEDVGVRRIEDSGSAIKQQRLDVAIDTHANALRWRGLGNHRVWVLAWAV